MRDSQTGSILIITLLIISVLVVTVTETMRRMQVEQVSAAVYTGSVHGQALARSGVAMIKYVLAWDSLNQKKEADHYGEPWADFQNQDEIDLPQLPSGELNATVIDEHSKFPINSLVTADGTWNEPYRRTFERLIQSPPFSVPEEKTAELMPALKDWLDADNQPTGVYGAEAGTYALEGKNATCRNGPMLFARELLLIKGMPRKLVTGAGDSPGLQDLITVHTQGAININTAPKEILAAMVNPSVNRDTAFEFATQMIEYRQDPLHFGFLSEPDWYRNRMAGYNDIQLPAGMVATTSNTFAVLLHASINGRTTLRYTLLKRSLAKDQVTFQTLLTETE